MALELELSPLPHCTECNVSDVEPTSPRQRPAAVGWARLLGLGETTARGQETGLSSLAEITRGAGKLHV